MNGLHPIKMPSAKEKVAAELRKAILSRQLQEGEAVTLESVANQLEVSVMPVREAFQILARDGLIKLQRNQRALPAARDLRECCSRDVLCAGGGYYPD